MIIEMARVRVMGPRGRLAATVRALQDRRVVHLVDASTEGLRALEPDAGSRRRRRHLERAIADVEAALDGLDALGAPIADDDGPAPREGTAARLGARTHALVERLLARRTALRAERDALRVYAPVLADLDELVGAHPLVSIHLLLLRRGGASLDELRGVLARAFGGAHDLRAHALPGGETAVLLIVPRGRAEAVERVLARARVDRAPVPPVLGSATLADALPRLRPRLAELERELSALDAEVAAIARARGVELARARRGLHDALIAERARDRASVTARTFVLEGWLPARERPALAAALARDVGPAIAVEVIAREAWHGDDAPVVLANPRVFRPFELLTAMLPLPRYGSVDPTPYVAVFFPMFFGVVVGDVGYGLLVALLAVILRAGSRPRSIARKLSAIAAAVAIFAVIFGVLYGEAFGDLGARVLGMRPVWFDRREAVIPFLALAIALGLAHVLVGLIVAAASRWRRDKREAIGRGLTAAMLVLIAIALAATLEALPSVFLRPAVIALLVAFPIVVVLEGASALLDLMSIVGHVMSYARVMALGTASVMLAVVANRMHGAFGSVAVGVVFALIFHLVNFAITLFSPTIQVLRLHYVEFFDTFFEPGGGAYRPLARWSPRAAPT